MTRRSLALLVGLSAIWGSSFLFIKLGVDEVEPSVVALGRVVVGAAILVPIAAARGGLGLLRGHVRTVAALGLLNNAVPFWLLGFAETRIDSGLAGVIQAAAPIFTVLLAIRLDPSQRVTGTRLAGVGVGFVGVALLVGAQTGGQVVGALAVLGAALSYSVSALFAGKRLGSLPPLHVAQASSRAASCCSPRSGSRSSRTRRPRRRRCSRSSRSERSALRSRTSSTSR